MAFYTNLINAWNSTTQPPTGVTGTPLSSGMSTQLKINAVNSWTVTGSVPTSLNVTGSQILNCINWTEFNALTAQQQDNVMALCNNPGSLLGGSGQLTHMASGMIVAYFSNGGPTILALTALAQSIPQPWCIVNGYPNYLTVLDATAAGLS